MRHLALVASPLLLMLTASAPAMPAVVESGRVLAQLDDVRAIYFVLIIVIVAMMGLVMWMQRLLIGNLTKVVEKLATSIDGMTLAQSDRTTVELVHNARVEMVLARVEKQLDRLHNSERPRSDRKPRNETRESSHG